VSEVSIARISRAVPSFLLAAAAPLLLLFGFGFGFVPGALAQKPAVIEVELNPATTSIQWTLNTTLHNVHGTFKLKSGSFRVDAATGDASGLIVIDATSAESGDSSRDKVMHRDVLKSARYPEITFRPTHVAGPIDLGANPTVAVSGILNLLGQDHSAQINVAVQQQGPAVHLVTHFKVPFVAWGLKDPSAFVFRVDKEVALDVDLAASLKQ
jgi:polyisoprenoid-binding protein YceI